MAKLVPAIGYVRVSTDEQAQSGLGLADQLERIRQYAALKGFKLVEITEDNGISAGKPLASRDGGKKLLDALKRRKAKAVIIIKLDRAFRNAADCLTTVEQWDRQSVALHIIDLGGNAIDTTSAAGKFMLTVLAGAAEMERNLTRERTKAALRVKKSRGERVTRRDRVPYGFNLSPRDDDRIVKNRREQSNITRMKRWRRDGLGYKRIADRMNDRGISAKQGGMWYAMTVKQVLDRAA